MSKENNNLRLLGSPVNLTYRSKKREDRKNIKNRPRSALQSTNITENQERFKRPFSADTKDRAPSTRSFLKTFSAELLQSYNNSPLSIKVLSPTEELLSNSKLCVNQGTNRDISSNASDYGSKDTFISLGTKIKAKAQCGKHRNVNTKNLLKYRNIARKGRKVMDSYTHDEGNRGDNSYGVEVTITEKPSPPPPRNTDMIQQRNVYSQIKNGAYESYFVSLEDNVRTNDEYSSRVPFSPTNTEGKKSIDAYSRHLSLNKQQLSLVEEESTQDLDSIPSQNIIGFSPHAYNSNETSIDNDKNIDAIKYVDNENTDSQKSSNYFINDAKSYNNFYNNIHRNTPSDSFSYKVMFSSTVIHTDTSSKDSGYPDSAVKETHYLQHLARMY